MSREVEKEAKFLLDKKSYDKLLRMTKNSTQIQILNNYLDTEDFDLYNNGCTLRLRSKTKSFEASKFKLQFKYLEETKEGVRTSQEVSLDLNMKDVLQVSSLINTSCIESPLNEFAKGKKLVNVGTLPVTRNKIPGVNHTYYLDYYELPNGEVIYELEVEGISPEDVRYMKKMMSSKGIKLERSNKSKYERFVDALSEIVSKGSGENDDTK